LVGAVAADPELRAWLLHRKVWTPLTPGLPCQPHTQWGVQILNGVGDPFNSAWKAHLAFLASQQQSCTTTSASQLRVVPPASVASASGSSPRAKRQRVADPSPRGVKPARSTNARLLPHQAKQPRREMPAPTLPSARSSHSHPQGGTTTSTGSPSGTPAHPCGRATPLGNVT